MRISNVCLRAVGLPIDDPELLQERRPLCNSAPGCFAAQNRCSTAFEAKQRAIPYQRARYVLQYVYTIGKQTILKKLVSELVGESCRAVAALVHSSSSSWSMCGLNF